MSETDLDARLQAVERALTDDETDFAALREATTLAATVDDLEERVADLEATVEELDAAVQAVRGYAGNVRAVNREVERRASAALAKAETLESSVEAARGRHVESGREHASTDDRSEERRPPVGEGRASSGPPGSDARTQSATERGTHDARDGTVRRHDCEGNENRDGDRPENQALTGCGSQGESRRGDCRANRRDGPASAGARRETDSRYGIESRTDGRLFEDRASDDRASNDRASDDASGTEQFIERVKDAL